MREAPNVSCSLPCYQQQHLSCDGRKPIHFQHPKQIHRLRLSLLTMTMPATENEAMFMFGC
jgi:hypothetical protein